MTEKLVECEEVEIDESLVVVTEQGMLGWLAGEFDIDDPTIVKIK